MSKICAKCDRTVYTAEELKCLDKVWHKNCFRCWECNMILTLKTYKGFDKLPYCNAHYPQIRATSVAETPEGRRLKEQTKLNSLAEYQSDFRTNIVGKVTAVADDPETMRVRQVGKFSGNSYTAGAHTQYQQGPSDDYDDVSNTGSFNAAPPPPTSRNNNNNGAHYKAIYDYEAQDADEVSFSEGDLIVNAEVLDEGWISGTVQSTGQKGLIPANYVEAA